MADNRDLVEAYAFNRRRLVTAFVTGSVDRELPRPWRALTIGLLLALLMVAGAAAAPYVVDLF